VGASHSTSSLYNDLYDEIYIRPRKHEEKMTLRRYPALQLLVILESVPIRADGCSLPCLTVPLPLKISPILAPPLFLSTTDISQPIP
jgi:hypothetical protein